jgi:hypothetical protein
LTDLNSFKGGGMNNHINAIERPSQPIPVPDIADEKPQSLVIPEIQGHLRLLVLITAVDADALGDGTIEQVFSECPTEGASPSCDYNIQACSTATL